MFGCDAQQTHHPPRPAGARAQSLIIRPLQDSRPRPRMGQDTNYTRHCFVVMFWIEWIACVGISIDISFTGRSGSRCRVQPTVQPTTTTSAAASSSGPRASPNQAHHGGDERRPGGHSRGLVPPPVLIRLPDRRPDPTMVHPRVLHALPLPGPPRPPLLGLQAPPDVRACVRAVGWTRMSTSIPFDLIHSTIHPRLATRQQVVFLQARPGRRAHASQQGRARPP